MSFKWNQIAGAFLVGLLVGVLAGGSAFVRNIDRHFDKKSPQEHMLKQFARKLDLTDEQKNQVKIVFEQKWSKMDAIFAEMKPKFDQVRTETNDEIRKFLNPDQQKKLAEMEAKKSKRPRRYPGLLRP